MELRVKERKITFGKVFLISGLLLITILFGGCSKKDKTIAGAALGAGAGAAIGSAAGNTEGAIIGGAAGGILGGIIGNKMGDDKK